MFFVWLGRLPLLEPDEGRNAEVAREMLAAGEWLVPHYDGFAYLDKPPVLFWSEAASFKIFGLSEFAARFPSALAALATLFLAWFLAFRMFGDKAGLYAGIVFAVSPLVVIFSRVVIFDMPLTFCVTAALLCFWLGETTAGRRRIFGLLFFAFMGVATLVKGPVGFLLPLLVILVYSALRRRLRDLKWLPWGWGSLVFCAVVLPWFIAVCLRHPDFPRYALLEESVQRFLTPEAHRSGSVFYYIPVYLAGFLPWSFFLLFAALSKIKKWRALGEQRFAPILFLLVWAGVIFVFFSVSHSKLAGYFLPALVPLSILMGFFWGKAESAWKADIPDWVTAGFAALIGIGLLFLVAPQWLHFHSVRLRLERKLSPGLLELLAPTAIYCGVIVAALGVLGRNLLGRKRRRAPAWLPFVLAGLVFPLMLIRSGKPLSLYAAHDSSRLLAHSILASPQKNWPIYGYYYFRTGLPFYLRKPVGLVSSGASELTSNYIISRWPKIPEQTTVRMFPGLAGSGGWPGGKPVVVKGRPWLDAPGPWPVLVLVRNDQVPNLAKQASKLVPLWSGWDYSVWGFWPRGSHSP